ncbi:hypothetical protein Poli38472_000456 [Pythium oligandrum]|uniref:Uncharacterized protein n=1 Tax=Pythium oligandrum TaxID=41045 RepID=A0A8K1CBN9_PYTOL|nr:hypothetical protein Poli38472_000456 [Pythium oligandrum]|eukprot:TMW60414.1 hypothetical protein Poli38472_000456 [Pythium oligandrum]
MMSDEVDPTRMTAIVSAESNAAALQRARARVEADARSADALVELSRALQRMQQYDEAVRWCKKGLEMHPGHADLESELRKARLAVVNDLLDDEDDDDDEAEDVAPLSIQHGRSEATYSVGESIAAGFEGSLSQSTEVARPQTGELVFEEKVVRLLKHLDLTKLAQIGVWYTILELLRLKKVTTGLGLLFLGILTHGIMHRHKLMVVSMVFVCLYRSHVKQWVEQRVNDWVHKSSDKLGVVTWVPRVVLMFPIVLKVFGHLKFMVFLQQDVCLWVFVAAVAGICVASTFYLGPKHPMKHWGHGKRLKFASYAAAILYWAVWRGNFVDTSRLLAPALIDGGGIVLSMVTSGEFQGACRRAWKRLYVEVSADLHQDIEFDAMFFFGLSNWVIDYWQQPTNFSLEILTKMLADGFQTLEKSATHVFRHELRRLSHQMRDQMRDVRRNTELSLLVTYMKQSLNSIPPPKRLAFIGLFAKRCPSYVVGLLLLVFYGTLSVPLLPFLVSEAEDARLLYELSQSGDLEPMDGLDVLLLSSPLLRVWENTKAAVYCLEGGVAFSTAVATGTRIFSVAKRVGRLAAFAAKVKGGGLAAHVDQVPDHVVNAFSIAKDYGDIASGLQHVYDSVHTQDFGRSLRRWWHGRKE